LLDRGVGVLGERIICQGSPRWGKRKRARCPYISELKENGSEDPPLQGPEEVELFLDAGEVFVAGGEGGFAVGGEGEWGKLESRKQKVEVRRQKAEKQECRAEARRYASKRKRARYIVPLHKSESKKNGSKDPPLHEPLHFLHFPGGGP